MTTKTNESIHILFGILQIVHQPIQVFQICSGFQYFYILMRFRLAFGNPCQGGRGAVWTNFNACNFGRIHVIPFQMDIQVSKNLYNSCNNRNGVE